MTNIRKVVIQLTILAEEADFPLTNNRMELSDIVDQIDEGAMIGTIRTLSNDPVPAERLREELLAMGNDGDFFNYLDEED